MRGNLTITWRSYFRHHYHLPTLDANEWKKYGLCVSNMSSSCHRQCLYFAKWNTCSYTLLREGIQEYNCETSAHTFWMECGRWFICCMRTDYATLLGLQTTHLLPKRTQIVKFVPSVLTSTFTKFLIFPPSDEYNFTIFCVCQESQIPTLTHNFRPVLLCKPSTLNSIRRCSLSCLQLLGK
jgi:hypothetical protein